jgi:DNA-directed RNA polymerase specialized sigma24 family protein
MVKTGALASDGKTDDRDRLFASTSWTAVFDAAQSSLAPARAKMALSDLCTRYWRPLYIFLRGQGFNSEDAQDLTQGFFVDLIQTRAYARADPAKGRFRSFLLGAMKHFVADARDRSNAKKRGGDAIWVPITTAVLEEMEKQIGRSEMCNPDYVYEREWAAGLVRRAFDRLAEESVLAGKSVLFDSLKSHLSGGGEEVSTYETISAQLGRPVTTLRSDVARFRARYRDILRDEVSGTVEEPSQVDDELRYLCQVLLAA